MKKSNKKKKKKAVKNLEDLDIPEERFPSNVEKIEIIASIIIYFLIAYLIFYTFNPPYFINGFYIISIILTLALFSYLKSNLNKRKTK